MTKIGYGENKSLIIEFTPEDSEWLVGVLREEDLELFLNDTPKAIISLCKRAKESS